VAIFNGADGVPLRLAATAVSDRLPNIASICLLRRQVAGWRPANC